MGTYEGYFCIKYFYLLTVVFYMWCHSQKTTFPQMLLILVVLTFKLHPFSNSAGNALRIYEKKTLLQSHCLFSIWLFPPLSVPASFRKIVKGTKDVCVIVFMLCVCIDRCALTAGVSLWECVSVHTCVKVKQGCCVGVKWTPLCLPSACWHRRRGHQTGIKVRAVCVCVCEGVRIQIMLLWLLWSLSLLLLLLCNKEM